MKLKFLIPLLLTGFIACSKSDDNNPDPVNPVVDDSIYLSKFFIIDTTLSAPADTIGVNTYDYDNLNRVSRASIYGYASGSASLRFTFDYFYSGSDTIANRVLENSVTAFTLTNNHLLHHDAQGHLTRDSSHTIQTLPAPGDFGFTHTYTYLTDGFIDSTFQGGLSNEAMVSQIKNSANLVTQQTSNSQVFTFSYDGHPNPFYRLSPLNASYMQNSDYPAFLGGYYTAQSQNFSQINNITYTIKYKSNGYPKEFTQVSNPSSSQDKYKYVLIYKKL